MRHHNRRRALRSLLHSMIRAFSDYSAFIVLLVLGGSIFGGVITMIAGMPALELIFWRSGFFVALIIVTLIWLDNLLDVR